MAVPPLLRHVRTALEQSGLASGKLLVVAVSGGPDSLAMLHALDALRDSLQMRLHGAHLDHGLRGAASKQDARFVVETFDRLGIAYTLEEASIPALRVERGLSLEEAAREVRYDFLARVAARQRADAIAIGHTSDDQAETVLMNIIRGTGLTGLRGMEPVATRTFGGRQAVMVRPLLHVRRQHTVAYCRAMSLEPREDASNLSLEPRRNRVRNELLPLLEEYNPAIRQALARLARSALLDVAFMESEVDRVWHDIARAGESQVSLNRSAFLRLKPALQAHLLRRAVLVAKGDLVDLAQDHVEGMARLMAGPAGRSMDLPGGIRFNVGYDEATLAPSDRDLCPLPPIACERRLNVPGETRLTGWLVTATVLDRGRQDEAADAPTSRHVVRLDLDGVGRRLWIRSRLPCDRFQPLGMSQSKKLQDFMVDSKIPRPWRDRVPLVVSPRGIAWVVGWRIAEWARPIEDRPRLLELRFRPGCPLATP